MSKQISKVQKEYFENRLRSIVTEKEAQARNKYPTQITVMELTELIDKGEVQLKSNLKERAENGEVRLCGYINIQDWFDLSKLQPIWDKNLEKIQSFSKRLRDKEREIMDAYMFGETGLVEAIKQLEAMEV